MTFSPRKHATLLILACLLVPQCLCAEEAPNLNSLHPVSPGSVTQLILAHDLMQTAAAKKDALTAVAAARLVQGVVLHENAGLQPISVPDGNKPSEALPAVENAAKSFFENAREWATGDDLMLEMIEREIVQGAIAPPAIANRTRSRLSPGQSDVWRIPLYGDVGAEIGLLGDGESNLDLSVEDANGNMICRNQDATALALCAFVPAESGFFTATVKNAGQAESGYSLLTN